MVKIIWNVKGINSKYKRSIVFHQLEKFKSDILCIQEMKIKQSEVKYARNPKLGIAYISAANRAKRGIVLYIKKKYRSKEIFNDEDGRYVAAEVKIENLTTLVVGIYAPNEKRDQFYLEILEKLKEMNYSSIIMVGDFNAVIDPKIDRKVIDGRKIRHNQGKLPSSFIELIDEFKLVDIWRQKYKESMGFTFVSEVHNSLSRIDLCLISKNLSPMVTKMDILVRYISDHNPIEINIKTKKKDCTWRLRGVADCQK